MAVGPVARLRSALDSRSVSGSAAAMVASTGITGGLGVVFWIVAARRFSPEEVGRASAAVSGLLAVSGIAQLELYGILTKFLPLAGRRGPALVLRCYTAAVVLGLLLASVAVLVAPQVSEDLRVLQEPVFATLFVAGVGLWGVFVLQDGVLVGLRKAHVTVVENAAFSIVKLLVVVLGLGSGAAYLFGAYLLPVVLALVPINWLVFRRYLPQLPDADVPLDARTVFRFARWDVIASWTSTATVAGVPLLVISAQGAASAGLFYAAWSMVTVLDLLAVSVGTSLVVASGYDPAARARAVRGGLLTVLAVLVPVVCAVALAAPLLLQLFGSAYADSGGGLLRVLALAALPRAVVLLLSAGYRAEGRPGWAATNAVVTACASLLAVGVAARGGDLLDVGVGWLAGSALAAVLLAPLWWRLHRGAASGTGTLEESQIVPDSLVPGSEGAGDPPLHRLGQ